MCFIEDVLRHDFHKHGLCLDLHRLAKYKSFCSHNLSTQSCCCLHLVVFGDKRSNTSTPTTFMTYPMLMNIVVRTAEKMSRLRALHLLCKLVSWKHCKTTHYTKTCTARWTPTNIKRRGLSVISIISNGKSSDCTTGPVVEATGHISRPVNPLIRTPHWGTVTLSQQIKWSDYTCLLH